MREPRAIGAARRAPVVLAFDTAASSCSIAVGCGNAVLAHERREMRHGHAEALLPMIDRAIAAASLTPAEIGIVAVSVGPGGFTGIRAGLAAARGLALATRAQLVGVSSFMTVAALVAASDDAILVALDSRRTDFYMQIFTGGGEPLVPPAAILSDEVSNYVAAAIGDAKLRIAGDAADRAATACIGRNNVTIVAESASDALGVLVAARRQTFDAPAHPLYLRPPDVSFPKARGAPA